MTPKKVSVVTGCSGGIGLACVRCFADHGYAVCGVDLSFTDECRNLLARSGGLSFETDVTQYARAHEIIQEIDLQMKRIDALVTCAGIFREGSVKNLSESDWDRVIDVDLKGTWNYLSAVAGVFSGQNFGKIVTVASTQALRARRSLSNYVAAKAGVVGLTRAAARDLGRFNVNVNAVAPGLVLTPLADKIPPETRDRLLGETCLQRLGTPEEIAGVIYFLCTEEARHITGEVIRVDGGQLA